MRSGESESLLRAAVLICGGLSNCKNCSVKASAANPILDITVIFFIQFFPFGPPTPCSERIARTHLLVKALKIEPSGQIHTSKYC